MVHRRREADNVCGYVVRLQGSRTKTKAGLCGGYMDSVLLGLVQRGGMCFLSRDN
jgi:hypothetical protein